MSGYYGKLKRGKPILYKDVKKIEYI